MEIINIPLDQLRDHPRNPRRKSDYAPTNPKMRELIASVAEIGVQEPAHVVALPGAKPSYQVISGHRRWSASEAAGKTSLPSIVRDLSPDDAFTTMLLLNIQREQPDPLMEAACIAELLRDDLDLAAVAARLGKSEAWARRRARLAQLDPKWIDFRDKELPKWGLEHLELVARYDTAVQLDLLKEIEDDPWCWESETVQELSRKLGSMLHEIARAPWAVDDAVLVPKAGACSACPKRTSCQATLFDEPVEDKKAVKGDRCTDHLCWSAKETAYVAKRQAELLKEHPGLKRIATSHASDASAKNVIQPYRFEVVKKTDKGAQPAVVAHGPGLGQIKWIREHSGSGSSSSAAAGPKPLKEKREQLAKRRRCYAYGLLLDLLQSLTPRKSDKPTLPLDQLPPPRPPTFENLVAWAITEGVEKSHDIDYAKALKLSPTDRAEALRKVCLPIMHRELNWAAQNGSANDPTPKVIASMLVVDLDALHAKAVEQIPEPKAWAAQAAAEKAAKSPKKPKTAKTAAKGG